jgi:[protein-PII] uridylyltransferase
MVQVHLSITEVARGLNEAYLRQRASLAEAIRRGDDSLEISYGLAEMTDAWILGLWRESAPLDLHERSTLYALGGYGRRELAIGSDIDLLIEVADDDVLAHPELHDSIERLMSWCREAKSKLSHAVRTPAQGRAAFVEDYRSAVAILDARHLDGQPRPTWNTVDADAAIAHLRYMDEGRDFVRRLFTDLKTRSLRQGQTVYLLEPDIKNGQGGLRDLNAIHWAALVRWNLRPLEAIRSDVGWSADYQTTYRLALRWLLTVRNLLHLEHGRKHDRLNFPDQESLARFLVSDDTPAPGEDAHSATERMMRDHYRIAREISTTAERFLRRWMGHQLAKTNPVGTCFLIADKQLSLQSAHRTLRMSADEVFEAIELTSRHDAYLDPELELAIVEAVRHWGEPERQDQAINLRLRALLTEPDTSAETSQRLLDLGILTRLIPEFEPIVCHVQHDVYHVYTTDIHSLKCLELARDLLRSEGDDVQRRWPVFAGIARQIEDRQVLLLSALFHDIGKNRGGNHSQKGAELMLAIGPRQSLEPRRLELLAFLIREHLSLSRTARRRDITDPRIIRDLASRLGTVETLNLLTVLTFCDMSTVGPNVMSDWNANLLTELYRRLRTALEHGVEQTWKSSQEHADRQRDHILHWWHEARDQDALPFGPGSGAIEDRIHTFIRDLPRQHLLETSPEALLRQFFAYDDGRSKKATGLLCTPVPDRGYTELIVSGFDIPGGLAKIAGVISSLDLDILTAGIVTTSSGRTLDIFHIAQSAPALVASSEPQALTDPRRIQRLTDRLHGVLDGNLDVEELIEQRRRQARLAPRPTPSVETCVTAHQDLSDNFTVVEVRAPDQIGLLYLITRTLWQHDVSTQFSKIDSLGTQVIDTFYVENANGGKLSTEKTDAVLSALRQAIGELTTTA